MKELMELMKKKKEKSGKMSDSYKSAKMSMLDALKSEMSGMMADDMKGLKKVTVAAKDEQGLKEGLEKAEDMIEGEQEDGEVCPDCGMVHEQEDGEMSSEEIDQMIAKLMEKKKAMMDKVE